MKPVRILRNRKGFQLLHCCTGCGKEQVNRVAMDTTQDDFEGLLDMMRRGAY